MQTQREKAQSAKTLICLLQSLVNKETSVELRDDSIIEGTVQSVDGFMNVELTSAVLKTPTSLLSGTYVETKCDYFFVKGTRIRYVHIPDDVDPIAAIQGQLKLIRSSFEYRFDAARQGKERKKWPTKAERKAAKETEATTSSQT